MDPLTQIRQVSVWKRGSQRAPHKPLLLLLALAAVQREEGRLLDYVDIERRLINLLIDFGPPRKTHHPEFPFWRLQNDGDFWEIPGRDEIIELRGERMRTGDVPTSILRKLNARGGFSKPIHSHLRANPKEVAELTGTILEEHFQPSLHESILDAVGMPWLPIVWRRQPRDPAFREELIRLYERRCAVCGFDGMIGRADLAVEAAHVRWHAHGGTRRTRKRCPVVLAPPHSLRPWRTQPLRRTDRPRIPTPARRTTGRRHPAPLLRTADTSPTRAQPRPRRTLHPMAPERGVP